MPASQYINSARTLASSASQLQLHLYFHNGICPLVFQDRKARLVGSLRSRCWPSSDGSFMLPPAKCLQNANGDCYTTGQSPPRPLRRKSHPIGTSAALNWALRVRWEHSLTPCAGRHPRRTGAAAPGNHRKRARHQEMARGPRPHSDHHLRQGGRELDVRQGARRR